MMFKAVVFDFFDVVHKDHQKAWFSRHGFTRSGIYAEASNQLDTGLIDYDEYVSKLSAASGQSATEIRRQFVEFAELDQETVQVIRDLRQHNYKTALLSNSNSGEIRPILERHQLEPIFDEIIVSGEAKLAKPDPGAFELMLKRLDAWAHECIFTDDSLRNIEAASLLNFCTIHFKSAGQLRQELTRLKVLPAVIS